MAPVKGRDPAIRTSEHSAGATAATDPILIARRIWQLRRRRSALIGELERLRASLPEWAIDPLKLVGMSQEQIRSLVSAWSDNKDVQAIEDQLDELDNRIIELTEILAKTPASSLEEIEFVLRTALIELKESIVSNPNDVLFDPHDHALLRVLERINSDLRTLAADALIRIPATEAAVSTGKYPSINDIFFLLEQLAEETSTAIQTLADESKADLADIRRMAEMIEHRQRITDSLLSGETKND